MISLVAWLRQESAIVALVRGGNGAGALAITASLASLIVALTISPLSGLFCLVTSFTAYKWAQAVWRKTMGDKVTNAEVLICGLLVIGALSYILSTT